MSIKGTWINNRVPPSRIVSFYWMRNRQVQATVQDYLRIRQNCFDHVSDLVQQPSAAYWVEESAIFHLVYQTSYMVDVIGANSGPEMVS
jgi:hypothetical protein